MGCLSVTTHCRGLQLTQAAWLVPDCALPSEANGTHEKLAIDVGERARRPPLPPGYYGTAASYPPGSMPAPASLAVRPFRAGSGLWPKTGGWVVYHHKPGWRTCLLAEPGCQRTNLTSLWPTQVSSKGTRHFVPTRLFRIRYSAACSLSSRGTAHWPSWVSTSWASNFSHHPRRGLFSRQCPNYLYCTTIS